MTKLETMIDFMHAMEAHKANANYQILKRKTAPAVVDLASQLAAENYELPERSAQCSDYVRFLENTLTETKGLEAYTEPDEYRAFTAHLTSAILIAKIAMADVLVKELVPPNPAQARATVIDGALAQLSKEQAIRARLDAAEKEYATREQAQSRGTVVNLVRVRPDEEEVAS